MFVHRLLSKLQTKNNNRFEYVILTERQEHGHNRGEKHTILVFYLTLKFDKLTWHSKS